jgi:transposase
MSRDIKYIGMDVHKEAIVIAVLLSGSGKLVMESIVESKASSILQFIHGLRGELQVTWEEGTWAAWLYDLLQPQVKRVLVCDPRRNALLKEGNKSDKIDARKLADLLRTGMVRPVYHGEHGLRTLRELGRSYQTIRQDLNRVMNRIKALYRGWSIPCAGTQVYAPRYREEWLHKIEHVGVRRRAELLYQQLDGLQALRRTLRPELLAESRKHKASKFLPGRTYLLVRPDCRAKRSSKRQSSRTDEEEYQTEQYAKVCGPSSLPPCGLATSVRLVDLRNPVKR